MPFTIQFPFRFFSFLLWLLFCLLFVVCFVLFASCNLLSSRGSVPWSSTGNLKGTTSSRHISFLSVRHRELLEHFLFSLPTKYGDYTPLPWPRKRNNTEKHGYLSSLKSARCCRNGNELAQTATKAQQVLKNPTPRESVESVDNVRDGLACLSEEMK